MTSPTSKRQRTSAALSLLQARFPALFPSRPSDVRPLALGIHQALAGRLASDADADPKGIGWALRKWCKRDGYKRALSRGGDRIDPDGHPIEPVSEEHRRAALALVEDLDADRRAKAQLKPGKRQAPAASKERATPPPPPRRQPPQRQPERPQKATPSPSTPSVRAVEVIVKKRRKIVKPE